MLDNAVTPFALDEPPRYQAAHGMGRDVQFLIVTFPKPYVGESSLEITCRLLNFCVQVLVVERKDQIVPFLHQRNRRSRQQTGLEGTRSHPPGVTDDSVNVEKDAMSPLDFCPDLFALKSVLHFAILVRLRRSEERVLVRSTEMLRDDFLEEDADRAP